MKINWPNPTKEPMDVRDLLQMNKKMIQELYDRWINPSFSWNGFTFDPNAVMEEIELYLKEGQTSNWKRGREFI